MDLLPAAVSKLISKSVPQPLDPVESSTRALYRLAANSPAPSRPAAARVLRPETLHPTLWLGNQLGRHAESAVPSGFAPLDAQLPGRGWPRRALTELLLPHPGVGEIRLLGPSLVATQKAGRLVMLFDPPARLSASALAQLGFDVEQLLIINTRARVIPGSDSLWALEQALKSGHVGAVLAWLPPRLRAERLRRLQLAAHSHDGPAFVLREMNAAQRPTAAPLRLGLRANGADLLAVRVFKRRGPPLAAPVQLALPPVLSSTAQQRASAGIATHIDANASIAQCGDIAQRDDIAQSADIAAAGYMKVAALRAATFINLNTG
jgi:protein ImuA